MAGGDTTDVAAPTPSRLVAPGHRRRRARRPARRLRRPRRREDPAPSSGLDLEGGTQIILEPTPTPAADVIDRASSTRPSTSSASASTPPVSPRPRSPPRATATSSSDPRQSPTQDVRDAVSKPRQLQLPPGRWPSRPARRSRPPTPSPTARHRRPEPVAVGARADRRRAAPRRRATAPSPDAADGADAVARRAVRRRRRPRRRAPAGARRRRRPTPPTWRWITPRGRRQQFDALDCTDPARRSTDVVDDPAKPLVTCDDDGVAKYILGPVAVSRRPDHRRHLRLPASTSRAASPARSRSSLDVQRRGHQGSSPTSRRDAGRRCPTPQNQFAIVLDGLVISAPRVNDGRSSTASARSPATSPRSGRSLANQLKYGALPLSFVEQTQRSSIGPTLGSDQLRRPASPACIGLLLVVVYSLLYYRGLGLVTVASLARRRPDHLRRRSCCWAGRTASRLDPGRRRRPDRRHRHHRRLVHRLLRTHP